MFVFHEASKYITNTNRYKYIFNFSFFVFFAIFDMKYPYNVRPVTELLILD